MWLLIILEMRQISHVNFFFRKEVIEVHKPEENHWRQIHMYLLPRDRVHYISSFSHTSRYRDRSVVDVERECEYLVRPFHMKVDETGSILANWSKPIL